LKCPKCESEWIADFKIVNVRKHKHWWSPVVITISFHEAYPKIKPYKCISCKHTWGEW